VDVTELIDAVVAELRRAYVLPERVPIVEAALRADLARTAFDGLAGRALCDAVTDAMRKVCPDRHLRVRWTDDADAPIGYTDADALARYREEAASDNYGIHRVMRKPGNVGLLDLRAIDEPEYSAPGLNAAMNLLANTGALLLDLRHNHGGAPSGVAYLCSFFFPARPLVHVNDVYDRVSDSTEQFWTRGYLPAPRYDAPVWVLVSGSTFSGGEEIAYNLQQLKRAKVVGETTRGGAHPTDEFRISANISIRVPTQRSINPVSGTNWEGVGVQPDKSLPADGAERWAYREALRAVLARLGEQPPAALVPWRDEAVGALAELE